MPQHKAEWWFNVFNDRFVTATSRPYTAQEREGCNGTQGYSGLWALNFLAYSKASPADFLPRAIDNAELPVGGEDF
jgi:hypothetical protein